MTDERDEVSITDETGFTRPSETGWKKFLSKVRQSAASHQPKQVLRPGQQPPSIDELPPVGQDKLFRSKMEARRSAGRPTRIEWSDPEGPKQFEDD